MRGIIVWSDMFKNKIWQKVRYKAYSPCSKQEVEHDVYRKVVCLPCGFLFLPCFQPPEGDNKAGQFQLYQVDFCTVGKVELVMRYYNSSERSNINHGTR